GNTPNDRVAHVTTSGDLVRWIDTSAADSRRPAGLTCAPGSQNPSAMNIYMTDRGTDNNDDPTENDGKVYELYVPAIEPDVTIVKTVDPASALAGESIAYTLTFSNISGGIATGVIVTDIIPSEVTVLSVETSGVEITDTEADPGYVWEVQDLTTADVGVITINAELTTTLECGDVFSNAATISTTANDTRPGNNYSEVWVSTGRGVTVDPLVDAQTADQGQTVTYELDVTNSGQCQDTFAISVDGTLWSVSAPVTTGPLDPGETTSVEVNVTVPVDAPCGPEAVAITFTSLDGFTSESAVLTTTVNPVYALTVMPPSSAISGDPPTVVTHTLWVTNAGNCEDTFGLVTEGGTWTKEAPESIGPLAAGMGASVDVLVTVPEDAQCGDDVATATFTSLGDELLSASSVLTTTANAVRGLTVEPDVDALSGDPGADVFYNLRVTNTGNCTDTFAISVTDNTWLTVAPENVEELAPGEGADVPVTVTVPESTPCNENDSAIITFTSSDDVTSDYGELTTTANTVPGVIMIPPSDSATAEAGEEMVYHLWVQNSGNCGDTFDLVLSGNTWPTEVVPPTIEDLAAGVLASVYVTVTVPSDATCGDDVTTLTATSQAALAVSDSSVLTTSLDAVYGLAVTPSSDAGWGDPNTDVFYTLRVTNTGNCPDSFGVAVEDNIWNTVAPDTVEELAPDESVDVEVTVTVPEDAGCGDNDTATVTFTSDSDGTKTDGSELTTSANAVYELTVDPPSHTGSGHPGAIETHTLRVTNAGNCQDTFDVGVSGNIWSTAAPDTVGPLARDEGADVDIGVTVPACTLGGDIDALVVTFASQDPGTASGSAALTTEANQLAPVANDDEFEVLEDTPLTVGAPGVLANDDDGNCEQLSASVHTEPVSGTVTLGANGSFIYTPTANFDGDDSFVYLVSDGVLTDTATVLIHVLEGGDNPDVDAGEDQTADEGEIVYFDGSFVDPARTLAAEETIHWAFGDGESATGTLTPIHAYEDNGEYTVILTVTDEDGDVGHDSLVVTVDNVAPTVDAGSDQKVQPGEPISFSGGFTDPGTNDTWTIEWDLGDGTIINDTLTFDYAYEDPGIYTVTLTITDDDGGVGTDIVEIMVMQRLYLPLIDGRWPGVEIQVTRVAETVLRSSGFDLCVRLCYNSYAAVGRRSPDLAVRWCLRKEVNPQASRIAERVYETCITCRVGVPTYGVASSQACEPV
ncbi:MAG: PKD domain-containing protein, partial [Anaerolineae bacterium]